MNASVAPAPAEFDEAALWHRFRIEGDSGARETLVLHYTVWTNRLARHVFMRVKGRSDDWPDYVQNAAVALLEAMQSFDPGRDIPFSVFAQRRIRGALFNGLRALLAGGTPVANGFGTECVDSLLEEPADDPVQQLIDVVSGLGVAHLLHRRADPEALNAPPTPYDVAVRSQMRERVARLLDGLPPRERSVLDMHYLHYIPFADIAQVLDLTRGRVSQLHHQALRRLHERLRLDAWRESL